MLPILLLRSFPSPEPSRKSPSIRLKLYAKLYVDHVGNTRKSWRISWHRKRRLVVMDPSPPCLIRNSNNFLHLTRIITSCFPYTHIHATHTYTHACIHKLCNIACKYIFASSFGEKSFIPLLQLNRSLV